MSLSEIWQDLREEASDGIQRRLNVSDNVKAFAYVDFAGRIGIWLEGAWREEELPEFRFIAVSVSRNANDLWNLSLSLRDAAFLALFETLCEDLVAISSGGNGDLNSITARLKRWRDLLLEAAEPFSLKKARGLLGELVVLEQVATSVGFVRAVDSWSGPMATPQDFYLPNDCLEVKAVGPGAKRIHIQEPAQVQSALGTRLTICVVVINEVAEGATVGVSLRSKILQIEEKLVDLKSRSGFSGRLQALGWRSDLEINDRLFEIHKCQYYEVRPDFPKIGVSMVPVGIVNVSFDVLLTAMEPFNIPFGLKDADT